MVYTCVTTSIPGFIQQLAVGYCARGYRYYVLGTIPAHKDPARVDAKLIQRYGLALSYATRSRRKQRGEAAVQYVRYNDVYVLMATAQGQHHFFEAEKASIKDLYTPPIHVFGYSISHRHGHVCVRIARAAYKTLKKRLLKRAVRDTTADLEAALRRLPYQPYAPIRSQLLCLVRAVNRVRRASGLPPIDATCVRLWRRSVRPFDRPHTTAAVPGQAA